jgi:hypothetical protein
MAVIGFGRSFEEKLDHGGLPPVMSPVHRGIAALANGVDLGAVLDEEFGDFDAPLRGADVEGAFPPSIGGFAPR